MVFITAAILGAEMIEIHVTSDKEKNYFDNPVSFDPSETEHLVQLIRKTEKINRSRYVFKEILSEEWDTSVIADYSDAEIEKMYCDKCKKTFNTHNQYYKHLRKKH